MARGTDSALSESAHIPAPIVARQCADSVLMVRPAAFGYNAETAGTNRFQTAPQSTASDDAVSALREFDAMVVALRSEGIDVCVAQDSPQPAKPDAIFPNNWVSFHADGTVVLYPMCAPNRRIERRTEIVNDVVCTLGFTVRRTIDLSAHEKAGRYLEGTGSLVLDHRARVAYACRSERTHADVFREWCDALEYEPVLFDALDVSGAPMYHTNVMLSLGERAAIIGANAIPERERGPVLERLAASGREVVALDQSAIAHFAGNMLELASWDESLGDCRVLVMSAAARDALWPAQLERLRALTDDILVVPVPTIERLGGGSVRCMMGEVFLP